MTHKYSICSCVFQLDIVIPFTFPTVDSYLRLSADTGQRLRVGFHFRTYNKGGLLFAHSLDPVGRAMVSIRGMCVKHSWDVY